MPNSSPDFQPQLELLHAALGEVAHWLISNYPAFQRVSLDLMDTVLVPRTVARQLCLAIALDTGMVTLGQVQKLVDGLRSQFSSRQRLIRQLQHKQRESQTQDEWMELAERIDNIQGNDVWRSDPHCPLYERERIAARIDEFIHLMRRRDIFELMFILRGGIARNKFGLLHEGLFSKALAGSKVLVETYHNVVCAALDFVCDAPTPVDGDGASFPIPTDARLAFFNETRHSYGRTALLLSGGAALGFYHVGVVKALMENNLMPRVIGGSSAGSILCSIIGTRTDEECFRDFFQGHGTMAPGHSGQMSFNFFRPLPRKNSSIGIRNPNQTTGQVALQEREEEGQDGRPGASTTLGQVIHNTAGAFQDPKRTWQVFVPNGLRNMTSFLYDIMTGNRRPGDLLKNDTNHFRGICKANIGNFTFQEAFDRTGRILNIVVTPKNSSDPPRLLNYLTAPHVLVWSAAVASASLPGVFEANRLMVKDADGTERYESAAQQQFSDGSMESDLPMLQLSEMFNVNHFVISQANPHAVMFASYNQERSIWVNPVTGILNSLLIFLKDQVRSWLAHVATLVGGRRISPLFQTQRDTGFQFFTQEYEGRDCDISLIPWHSDRSLFSAFLHLLYNPSRAEFFQYIKAAERETWKNIPAIKSHIAEEITLDRCVQRLRKRLMSEAWAKRRSESMSSTNTPTKNLGKQIDRVPSFFTSPSLVNLGGLGVADQTNLGEYDDAINVNGGVNMGNVADPSRSMPPRTLVMHKEAAAAVGGWGGMGLRGNRSGGNLEKTLSSGSGFFIEEDEAPLPLSASGNMLGEQQAGEQMSSEQAPLTAADGRSINSNYFKTTSMAKFYYRKSRSYSEMRKSQSDAQMGDPNAGSHEGVVVTVNGTGAPVHTRKKSCSHSDLPGTAKIGQDMDLAFGK